VEREGERVLKCKDRRGFITKLKPVDGCCARQTSKDRKYGTASVDNSGSLKRCFLVPADFEVKREKIMPSPQDCK